MVNDGRTFAMSCGKADTLLFGLYLCLCAACFFPRTAGFSDEWLLPKWYLALAVTAVLAMAEGYLFYIKGSNGQAGCRKGHSEVPRSMLFSAALSIVATLESLYALGLFFLQGDAGGIGAMGTFDNPAGLALCLCLSLPFMYHFARHSRSGTLQLAAYAAMCLAVTTVCLSRSRTGILCLAAFLCVILFVRLKIRWWLKAACVATVCLGAAVFAMTRKADSSSGRRFILERSWELIVQKPWTGHGRGGFEREYMQTQGQYFARHPESGYAWLADEVRHPLNEFVLAWVDYGVAAPCLLALCFAVAVYRLGKRKESFSPTLACSLSALFVFACFSYPSKYPLAWLVAALALVSLARRHLPANKRGRFWQVFPVALWAAAATLLAGIGVEYHYERTWSRAARRCLYGHSERMMPVYARLHRHYARNPYFLYNYAAEQFYAGRFAPALETAKECRAYWSSYNLELLTGDICRHLGRHEEAIAHYRQAGHMCPVRFAPLEGLYHAYKDSGQTDKADSISAVIRGKKAKVLSPEVARIKKNF